ncbi:hypothetical protein PN576_19055, partial [Parabacteroides merdae]|nr:hypothetical protein [Parabacteroides merdae]
MKRVELIQRNQHATTTLPGKHSPHLRGKLVTFPSVRKDNAVVTSLRENIRACDDTSYFLIQTLSTPAISCQPFADTTDRKTFIRVTGKGHFPVLTS